MSHKLQFIEKASAMGANISVLCREYGISRQTGHKWLRRFRAQGYTGLVEQSRRPISSPLATGAEIVVRVLELRDEHQTWGPDKIARVLRRTLGEDWTSTCPTSPPADAPWLRARCRLAAGADLLLVPQLHSRRLGRRWAPHPDFGAASMKKDRRQPAHRGFRQGGAEDG